MPRLGRLLSAKFHPIGAGVRVWPQNRNIRNLEKKAPYPLGDFLRHKLFMICGVLRVRSSVKVCAGSLKEFWNTKV